MSINKKHLRSKFIFIAELSILIGRKQQTIRKWISSDNLPHGLPRPMKINGHNCWLRIDIDNYLPKEEY